MTHHQPHRPAPQTELAGTRDTATTSTVAHASVTDVNLDDETIEEQMVRLMGWKDVTAGPEPDPTQLAPSTRQVLARVRRTVEHLATDATRPVRPGINLHPVAAAAVDAVLTVERLDPYMRSGRAYVLSNVLEYLWSFWPLHATSVSTGLRAHAARASRIADRLNVHQARDTYTNDDHTFDVVDVLQQVFSKRDPRLAWRLPTGELVLDELSMNHHPSGLLDRRMVNRIRGDLALGQAYADEHGLVFAGVRLLPLKRCVENALLATPDQPADSGAVTHAAAGDSNGDGITGSFNTRPLAATPYDIDGDLMTAGTFQ
jgi:hypothetical protein